MQFYKIKKFILAFIICVIYFHSYLLYFIILGSCLLWILELAVECYRIYYFVHFEGIIALGYVDLV